MKYKLTMLLCVITAILGGQYLGEYLAKFSEKYISWLGYKMTFGFDAIHLNLSFMDFTFGLHIDVCFMQILLIILAIYLAPKISMAIKAPAPPQGRK